MNIDKIILTSKKMLRRDEGVRLFPYKDSRGFLTIGVGRCLDKRGINSREAELMFDDDVYESMSKCNNLIAFFKDLDVIRQCVLVNMCFNLGIHGLLKFQKMLAALQDKNYVIAAAEMVDSNWHNQVGNRALRLEHMMRTGEISEEYI